MPWEIKARTDGSSDGHARYHDKDWLTVRFEPGGSEDEPGRILRCECVCGNEVYVLADTVYRRREKKNA